MLIFLYLVILFFSFVSVGWRAVTNIVDKSHREFWDVLFEWTPEMQKRFLRFVTGSDRVPVGGMAEMVIIIFPIP